MPSRIEPRLALNQPRPPLGQDWIHEVKWDGYRIAVHLDNRSARILTRGHHDRTHCFPVIEEAVKTLGVLTAIIDAETVVLVPQNSLSGRGSKPPSGQAMMMAFDLIY
ncbi:hypothetical protein K9B32_12465 [Rhizobium sp. 3T7]|uniref:ATP-dependent DNA ligase n=1 Tax=Rhizobium sp. 3T7 TaxID=2874922 RepID=UPI001CCC8913|nr:hypothetical protein [Rhizobium sp. 3T7]